MSQFTSRSEFDLEKRVHFTNEIPPYDMFDGLNSVLQTDLWKWILGYTKVEFDLPYSVDVDTGIVDSDGNPVIVKSRDSGIDNGEVYYKLVNGTVVEDVQYGPAESEDTTYHKLEEYGVVLPEFDYLLHEVYRYLGSMYPDHPDMINLLTPTEFDDMITNAGSVIDYEPDNKFFDKVASSFNNNNEDEVELEAAMLKIRNLKNEGFRKRLYGSKMGYRMLANDIFQTATVFPVATYLPIKPVDKDTYRSQVGTYDYVISKNGEEQRRITQRQVNEGQTLDLSSDETLETVSVSPITNADSLKSWNESTGHSFNVNQYDDYIRQHNRVIDTYSKYYYKKFRLIDYDGSKSSYPKPEDKNTYAYGYTIPFHEYSIYEFPPCADSYSSIVNAVTSSTITSSDYDLDTSYVLSIEDDVPLKTISYNKNSITEDFVSIKESTEEEVHSIKTSIRNYAPYKKLYVYPEFKDATLTEDEYNAVYNKNIESFIKKSPRDLPTENIISAYYTTSSDRGFTKDILKGIIKDIDVVYNPFISNTLFLKPSETISFYPYSVDITSDVNDNFYVNETPINWDSINRYSYVAMENLSNVGTTSISSLSQITNFTKGYVDIEIDTSVATANSQLFDVASSQYQDDRYAIIVQNENKDFIVFEGKLTVETTLSGGRYQVTKEHFDIAAIPNKKTDAMLNTIYNSSILGYDGVYSEILAQTKTTEYLHTPTGPQTYKDYVTLCVENGYNEEWARDYYSDDDDTYEAAKKNIQSSGLNYSNFLSYVKNLMACEEQISSWKENRSYLYSDTTYVKDGNEVSYEKTLICPTAKNVKVVGIMRGYVSQTDTNQSEYNVEYVKDDSGNTKEVKVINDNYYQDIISYSILGSSSEFVTGNISDISLGNLNTICIYGKDKNTGIYIPSTSEVVENTITITSEAGNDSFTFNYLCADKDISEHDTTSFVDYSTAKKYVIKDYYEQAYSTMDSSTIEYLTGKTDESLTNITITPTTRETIQIESVIDVQTEGKERTISFESDTAKEMFKSLSVGDVITGPSIDSDDNNVFIVDIGDNEVTVNVDLQQSGTFILNYSVKTNVAPTDIEDNLVQYKEDLYNNGLYSVTNPFEHGLWPSEDYPNVSTAILDSLPDISFYDIYNYRNNTNNSFTTILEDTHWDDYQNLVKDNSSYLMPSDIKFNNELFLELNLNKLIYYPTHKTETNPVLMSVEWLDYLEDSLMYSSRATDNVNVGVNLMMETDTTGYYTMLSNQTYTDPQIHLKFITLNYNGQNMWPEKTLTDDDWTTPCYAQVGTGGSGRKRWFKSPEDISYPSIWGVTTYDDFKKESDFDSTSDFYKNNGELKNVGVWGQNLSELSSTTSNTIYTSVETPLFEIPLGEYDTVTKYVDTTLSAKNLLSITQASFYAQTFNNLLKHFSEDESNIKIIGANISDNSILTSIDTNGSRSFTFSGNWVPTKTPFYKDGVVTDLYTIVYPENLTDMTYYVVNDDISLSNITEDNGKSKKTRTFSRSDVLFRFNNHWYVKSFQYMGLVGDGFDTISSSQDGKGNVNYIHNYVFPQLNKSLDDKCKNSVASDENDVHYATFIERLIQYYIRAVNIKSESYYSGTVPNIGFKEYNHIYVDTNNDTECSFDDAFKDFDVITPIHNDHILYYIYAGSFNPVGYDENLWQSERNRNFLKENDDLKNQISGYTPIDYSTIFSVGDRIALLNFCDAYAEDSATQTDSDGNYIECDNPDNWYVFKINTDSLLGATLPISKWRYVQDEELEVISDTLDMQDGKDKCGISTLLSKTCSTIDLPRSYITEGSYNFNITIDPHFLSEGYLYESDGTTLNKTESNLVTFCTTKGAIYYDDTNDAFYTYSNIQENGELGTDTYKIALKFNEQKFFKNTLSIPGIYQIKNTISTGEKEVEQTPVFKSISGLEFPMDKLATGDRLLEVKKLDLRSIYSTSLEPIFFSNYYNLNYPIKGVTTNNELYLSYIPSNPNSNVEQLNFTTNIMNLLPVNSVYDSDTQSYSTELATKDTTITFGNTYENPELTNISITKSMSDDSITDKNSDSFVDREFAYYKNNVVVRGKIDTANPKVIITPNVDGELFKSAVENISIGDTLVGAYALEPTGNEDKFQISIVVDNEVQNNAKIKYAYFANNQFRAVEEDGTIYYNDDINVSNVTTNVICKKAEIFKNNTQYQGDIQLVGWTKDLGWYVEIKLSNSTTIICSIDISSSGTVTLNQAYSSTGKHIFVDYGTNNENHTLVGHTCDEYANDFITPLTVTIKKDDGSTEGIQIKNDLTSISEDTDGNTVWTTNVYDGDNIKYTTKTVVKNTEEFFKAVITDTDTQEEYTSQFDGAIGSTENYNVIKYNKDGSAELYLIFGQDAVDGSDCEIIYPNTVNGVDNPTSVVAKVYLVEESQVWREYTYNNSGSYSTNVTPNTTVYTYEKSNDVLVDLTENGVVSGIGKTYVTDSTGTTEEDINVFYRDITLSNAKLTQSSTDSNLYTVDDDYTSEPYITDTAVVVDSNGTKTPMSPMLDTRTILKTDNSGKYTVYAKGRSLFVKSPTSIVEKDSKGNYKYNGSLTAKSFWKNANAPIFNEHSFLTIRSTLVNDKAQVDSMVDMSLKNWLSFLSNHVNLTLEDAASIKVDGRPLSADTDNELFDNLKDIFFKIAGTNADLYDSDTGAYSYYNKVTYDSVVSAMNKAKSNPGNYFCADSESSSFTEPTNSESEIYPLVIKYENNTWNLRCYGFRLITETVSDGYNVIGASKQTFAQLPSTSDNLYEFYTEYKLDDDSVDINYEYAYAMFAFYFTYYLCGNGENTDIISSTNISDIQFTDNSMLVTDIQGNINSIGLCYLHNRDDIENPEHWSYSTPPMSLSCYAVEKNIKGTANYKIGEQYISVPHADVLTKKNTYVIKSTYANDEIILMGGFIRPKTEISAIYDDFMKGDMSEDEYQAWKENRSDDEKSVETQLLEEASFKDYYTPIVLYSVDNGATFERMELVSTNGMSLDWEGSSVDKNYYVSGIVYADGEFKIFVSADGTTDSLSYYYYLEKDDDTGSFDFSVTSGTKVMDEYGDIAKAHEFDIDAETGMDDLEPVDYSSVSTLNTVPSGHYRMMFTENENCFYMISTMALRVSNGLTVSSKTSGSLTLSSALTNKGNTEFDVLLSFNVKADIIDSRSYLNMDRAEKYVSTVGDFYVPEVTKVDDVSTANRFYSYRELLQDSARNPNNEYYDPYGYPSVSEDKNNTLYEYNTIYDSDSNTTTKTPVTMTNSSGNIIYLCDLTGKHYIYIDDNNNRVLGTLAMRGTYNLDMFETASVPTYPTLESAESDSNVRSSDDTFYSILDLSDSKVVSICYDTDTPYLKISTNNSTLAKDVKDYLFAESDSESFAKYIESTTTYFNSINLATEMLDNSGDVSISKIKSIISDMCTYNSGTKSSPILSERYVLKDLYRSSELSTTTNSDGTTSSTSVIVSHKYWYDTLTNQYLLNKKRYLSALAYVPYNFMSGITAYKNIGFSTVNGTGGTDIASPITGVYLSNYGYGGSRSNSDLWENTLPWLVDPDAFSETEYLKNTNGDYVYLVDGAGSEIKSYNAEAKRHINKEFSIDVSNLNGSTSKDIYAYSTKNDKVTERIYNPEVGKTTVFTPIDTLTLGKNPFEIDLWAFSSYKLVDIDTKVSGEKIVPNISIKYYGLVSKNTYGEISCDIEDADNGISPDFEYDSTKKVLRYLGPSTLENKLYINTDKTVDVTKLNIVFYVNGEKQSLTYKVKFAETPVVTETMGSDGIICRNLKVVGSSNYSIHYNTYTLYQYKDSAYKNVGYNFDNNSLSLNLEIGELDSDKNKIIPLNNGISLTNLSQNCLLNSQWDNNNGYLIINNKSVVDTPSDTIKYIYNGVQGSLQVPIMVLGNVKTYENYVINSVSADVLNKKTSINGSWIRSTYIDNILLDERFNVSYNDDSLEVIINGDSDYSINSFTNELPDLVKDSGSTSGYYINLPDGNVFNPNDKKTSLSVKVIKIDQEGELSDTVYTNGIYDKVPCRLPLYDTYRDLVNNKGFVINGGTDSIIYERNDTDTITVGTVNSDSTQVSFTENLGIDGYNDGEEHYIIMKWLTQSTIRTDLSICNDTDAFVEVSLSDKKLFTPDRIWFNPNGYPTPSVTIGNNIYNIENNEVYESDSYKNNNGYTIYRCNEDGCLVGYASNSDSTFIASYDNDNDGLPENVEGYILDSDGNVKSIAYEYVLNPTDNTLSDAMIPRKPTYDSCQEWFENEFYIKGHESNPYWQVLNISSKFNNAKKAWEQNMKVSSYVRSTQEMVLEDVDDDDKYINPIKATSFEQKNTSYIITPNANIVNLTDGTLSFILDKPSDKYQTEQQFVKYGITATNPFYENDIWTGSNMNLACYLDSTYTVCSTENLADPRDTESEIQEVTELGLFNKYHQLIAYAVFPPIEYRTSSQHISFTCYVKQGSCIDPSTLI